MKKILVILFLLVTVSSAIAQTNWSDINKPGVADDGIPSFIDFYKPDNKTKKITWHCVDAMSYDGNAYNDNKCTSSTGEVRYVSDFQAKKLDPSYKPGKSGAWYYNNK